MVDISINEHMVDISDVTMVIFKWYQYVPHKAVAEVSKIGNL